MIVQPTQTSNHKKYDRNGKGWCFRFNDDNKMSYKCIFHSSTVERVSWTPTTLYFAKKIMKITKRTYNISDTRSTEYTHKHFRSYKKLLCEPGCSPWKGNLTFDLPTMLYSRSRGPITWPPWHQRNASPYIPSSPHIPADTRRNY